MERREDAPPRFDPTQTIHECASFGVRYLDDMLATDKHGRSGLPVGSVTAIIGEANTQKSRLGYAFLAQAFQPVAEAILNGTSKLSNAAFSILLTTRDVNVHGIAKEVAHWFAEDYRAQLPNSKPITNRFINRLATAIRQNTICRRLEVHDLAPPVLLHIFSLPPI